MPWNGSYGFLFTHDAIVRNAPTCSGVYALFTPQSWVYIGESDDIQRSLLELKSLVEHLSEEEVWLWRYPRLAFGYWGLAPHERVECWKSLVQELRPKCNRVTV